MMDLIFGLFLLNLFLVFIYTRIFKEKVVHISGSKITITRKYLFHKKCYQVYSEFKYESTSIDLKEYFYANGGKVDIFQEYKINDMIDEYHLRIKNDLPI